MKSFFKNLNTIFLALGIGQILFCLVILLVLIPAKSLVQASFSTLLGVAVLLLLGGISLSTYLYKKSEKVIPLLLSLEQKMEHYRQHSLIRWACIEAPNLFALIVLLLENNQYALYVFGLGIAFFTTTRPSKEAFEKRYGVILNEHGHLK